MLLLKISQLTDSRVHRVFSSRIMSLASQSSSQLRYFLSSQQKLPTTVSRWLYRELPRLPLDTESLSALIKKDVTVFTHMSHKSKRFHMLVTIFGGIQFLCWVNMAVFVMDDPTVKQAGKSSTSAHKSGYSWMSKFYSENLTRISFACFSLGCLALFFTVIYPRRTVALLTLLRGGNKLGITTYSHFGRTRYFTVPLEHVSCKRSRLSSPTHAAMKIRGHWMWYLMDQKDGRFLQPELFDYVIGLNRSFNGKHLLEEYESHVSTEQSRMEASQSELEKTSKMVLDIKSGVEHLSEKLKVLKLAGQQSEVTRSRGAVSSDEYVLDELSVCEEKLLKLIEELQASGKDVDQLTNQMLSEQFHTTLDIKVPQHNTRVKLPAVAKDTMYDDEDASGDDEDIMTRQGLKKQSQLIIESKTRRGRPGKRKKKGTAK